MLERVSLLAPRFGHVTVLGDGVANVRRVLFQPRGYRGAAKGLRLCVG